MSDLKLINAYKKARDMIAETPDNKDNIVNAYIDLVEKIDNYYNGGNNNNNNNNNNNKDLSNMLKNPLEIEIYNNFQQYGAGSTVPLSEISNMNSLTKTDLSYEKSANLLMSLSDYRR
jgi:hypothetical protein